MSKKKEIRRKLCYVRKHLHEIMKILEDDDWNVISELVHSTCGILSVVDCWTYSGDFNNENSDNSSDC